MVREITAQLLVHRHGLDRGACQRRRCNRHGGEGAWRGNEFVELLLRSSNTRSVFLRVHPRPLRMAANLGSGPFDAKGKPQPRAASGRPSIIGVRSRLRALTLLITNSHTLVRVLFRAPLRRLTCCVAGEAGHRSSPLSGSAEGSEYHISQTTAATEGPRAIRTPNMKARTTFLRNDLRKLLGFAAFLSCPSVIV